MNLEQLRSFTEVAERQHFTSSAEALHLSQPSLSRQIAALEADLGSKLFDRAPGLVALTAAGEALLPYARRMLQDAQSARRELGEIAGLARGRVRLGATPSLCTSIVVDVIAAFHAEHPGIEIELTERGSRILAEELAAGALDLALLTSSTAARKVPGLLGTPLLTEDLVVASSPELAPLTRKKHLTVGEVAALPLIAFHRSYDIRESMDAAFAAAGLTPSIVLEGPELDAALRFVERGLGVAIMPAIVARDRLRTVRLVEPSITRTIRMTRRSAASPSRATGALMRMIETTAKTFAKQTQHVRLSNSER